MNGVIFFTLLLTYINDEKNRLFDIKLKKTKSIGLITILSLAIKPQV